MSATLSLGHTEPGGKLLLVPELLPLQPCSNKLLVRIRIDDLVNIVVYGLL